jgi:predicted GH43/DUF377 family glycosyl hydrolase
MMMRWRKLGLVHCPTGELDWARQYAHLPTPVLLEPGKIRVYFAGLDSEKFGRVGYVDVDASDPTRILEAWPRPVLAMGYPGQFDDCGVNPSCLIRVEGRWRMYYIGWQRSHQVPYLLFAGVAESDDGQRFRHLQRTPVLDRTDAEPFLRSAPFVLPVAGGYRAWYVSATDWTQVKEKRYPVYVVRHATSHDGLNWSQDNPVCIDLDGAEFGIGRPWVVRDADRYRMWYSIRSHTQAYRIGYAESEDGLKWKRMDDRAGIVASTSGWDSEMICYAAVIDVNGRRLMFYNGNGHGASGFGVAELL